MKSKRSLELADEYERINRGIVSLNPETVHAAYSIATKLAFFDRNVNVARAVSKALLVVGIPRTHKDSSAYSHRVRSIMRFTAEHLEELEIYGLLTVDHKGGLFMVSKRLIDGLATIPINGYKESPDPEGYHGTLIDRFLLMDDFLEWLSRNPETKTDTGEIPTVSHYSFSSEMR